MRLLGMQVGFGGIYVKQRMFSELHIPIMCGSMVLNLTQSKKDISD